MVVGLLVVPVEGRVVGVVGRGCGLFIAIGPKFTGSGLFTRAGFSLASPGEIKMRRGGESAHSTR